MLPAIKQYPTWESVYDERGEILFQIKEYSFWNTFDIISGAGFK